MYKKVNILFLISLFILSSCSGMFVEKAEGCIPSSSPSSSDGRYLVVEMSDVSSLPSGPSFRTRSDEPGSFNERTVRDGYLFLFSGRDESSATVKYVYRFSDSELISENPGSGRQTLVKRIDSEFYLPSENVYMLLLLNGDRLINYQGSTRLGFHNHGEDSLVGKTYSQLNDIMSSIPYTPTQFTLPTIRNNFVETIGAPPLPQEVSYFAMTNSPLRRRSDGSLSILREVDKTRLYDSYEAAVSGLPSVTVYVERMVCKVDVSFESDVPDSQRSRFLGWALNNVNTRTNLCRNIDAGWTVGKSYNTDHMYSHLDAEYDLPMFSRDPNYLSTERGGLYLRNISEPQKFPTEIQSNPIGVRSSYCLENTFDFDNMIDSATTRIVLAYSWSNSTFYTVSPSEGRKSQTIYTLSSEVQRDIRSKILDTDAFARYKRESNRENTEFTESDFDVRVSLADNYLRVLEVRVSTGSKIGYMADEYRYAIRDEINDRYTIRKYNNGICYYAWRIRHFGDDEAPFSEPYTEASLGRYGLVRNQWYDIKLSISENLRIGDSVVPPLTNDPDDFSDNDNYYIRPSVKVRPWRESYQELNFNDSDD